LSRKTIIKPTYKVIALVLMLAVLLPSAVKLSHVFTHHKHEVCKNDSNDNTHFHELDVDCEFYKFKLAQQFYYKQKIVELFSTEDNFKITESQYEFISKFQKLQTSLRGPPQLI
tara:strand:+ start:510 stop:851 length:342 start_codon:yes stop_codon:yes gene_type:complete